MPGEEDLMKHERVAGVVSLVLFFLAGFLCLFMLSGCASMWQSIKSAAAPAAGGAAGAAVGSLAGPVGTLGGAAAGAAFGDSLEENASLRSGDTVGGEAWEKQIAVWRGRALQADEAATLAQEANSALWTLLKWSALGALVWWHWRNRANWKELGYWRGVWAHGVCGGKVCKV